MSAPRTAAERFVKAYAKRMGKVYDRAGGLMGWKNVKQRARRDCDLCSGFGWLENKTALHLAVSIHTLRDPTRAILTGRVVRCWECFPEHPALSRVRPVTERSEPITHTPDISPASTRKDAQSRSPLPAWRNDHGPECCCGSCVMKRIAT